MRFTFGLLLYNQQDYLLETLESIKYQIEHFGNGIECNLIVNDDCSFDNSLLYIQTWISENRSLFNKVVINKSNINLGTVRGQQYIIDTCETDCIKILACDDVLSSVDLFSCYDLLDSKSLDSYLRIELVNGMLHVNDNVLMKAVYLRNHINSIKAIRQGCFLHTPSTIYKRNLYYDADCEALNSKFKLFEDDPTWYQMIKNINDLNINFVDEAIVLYRVSSSSVSNSGSYNSPFLAELSQLFRVYESDTSGVEHIYFKSKNSNLPKYLRFDKYVDFFNRKKYKHYCLHSQEYNNLITKIHNIIGREQLYYDQIKKSAEEFKRKYLV